MSESQYSPNDDKTVVPDDKTVVPDDKTVVLVLKP